MQTRILGVAEDGATHILSDLREDSFGSGWIWADVLVDESDSAALAELTAGLRLDPLGLRDSVGDIDLPKVDDFGHHLLVVLHGLSADDVDSYEVDCFITERHLVTVRRSNSPALDALWTQVQQRPELATGGVDELAARLADVMTRRLLSVLDTFDDRVEELIAAALAADAGLLSDLTAVRSDLAVVRRIIHPQREAMDLLRNSTSSLVGDTGRRRFSDVFDVASRAVHGLDAARTALGEILDAYRGTEARRATDVTKVLTIYAAIMLPLSLVAGFFGMNFPNLPGLAEDWGWVAVALVMAAITVVSLGVFVAAGWIRRPSGRQAGATLGRGLIEAARTPVQIVGAVFEVTTMPLRSTASRASRSRAERHKPG